MDIGAALRAVVAALVAVGLGAAAPGPRAGSDPASGTSVAATPRPQPAPLRAVRVWEEWQAARAAAYSSGEVGALRRLHDPRSRAGRRDVAVLRAYAERGLTLDLATRTRRLSVLVARPRLVVVRVVARTRAVARSGAAARVLPTAPWQRRRLVLRLVDGRWRLSAATSGSPRGQP